MRSWCHSIVIDRRPLDSFFADLGPGEELTSDVFNVKSPGPARARRRADGDAYAPRGTVTVSQRADREPARAASKWPPGGQRAGARPIWSAGGVRYGTLMALLPELLGESPAVRGLRAKIAQLLRSQHAGRRLPPLLIEGETGTGKGLLARGIHRGSARADARRSRTSCSSVATCICRRSRNWSCAPAASK
ncbi:MAG: hypothetical protein DMD78_00210 [Candidatus Rokuibacteriota bacterium]|nr:MAG: hypothetical protein DMD78_00210 [Candidatus Rokubacteria bacterium]